MATKLLELIIRTRPKVSLFAMYFTGRFNDLEDPIATRQAQLEDSLKLFQFLHAVELEMAWIKEHKPQAASVDYGNSQEAVQNLLKKHNVCMTFKVNLQLFQFILFNL